MAQILLTEEQTRILLNSLEPVKICDPKGKVLTSVAPLPDAELIRQAKERAKSPGPWFTTAEVLEHLEKLQEAWDREGGFDRERMHQLLDELQQQKE